MANILLPNRFQIKLEKDQELDGIVKSSLSPFGEILIQNDLYFFGEYTNHGIKHIQDVLFSTDSIITDDTFEKILSYKDIGYYIMSVILHDIGMHLNLDGFISLIKGDYDNIRIKSLDDKTWNELWESYLNEARKFNGKELYSIFGDYNAVVRLPPFSNPGEITENDKKLIGEFIRRHHPRLAHEIAIKGFPGKTVIPFCSGLGINKKNLIGLIARSHGLDLRKAIDIIETLYSRENRKTPEGVHAIYLMILLRVSDYIQIDSGRTSKTLIKLKTFSSPISELEHNAHLDIEEVDYKYQDDPERIYITATPKESKMFLKLKKLFKNIQYEFDISWAVLGELYGNHPDEDKPKIKYRRITSNLDQKVFTENQDYVTDSFLFKTNDEIIKLLVAPLYGDDISYGVRELLQNSIDATKEREFLENKSGSEYFPEINVSIERFEGNYFFKIVDNGLGMDIDIIKNYFLSAGASFRKSSDWQKFFLDENKNAIVRRSGRFGVGLLSAFLIGDEIEVFTKRKDAQYGFKFKANLNTELINIIKDRSIETGTKIVIKINKEKYSAFENDNRNYNIKWFQWYTLSKPKINYNFDHIDFQHYTKFNPDCNDSLPLDYYSFNSKGYDKILWTYSDNYANVNLTCNGIVIPNQNYLTRKDINKGVLLKLPRINVFDSNGILPLTLDRNSISNNVSFNKDLLEDIYKDFIAYFLTYTETSYIIDDQIFFKNKCLNYPGTTHINSYESYENNYGFNRYNEGQNALLIDKVLFSKKGFILNYNYFIKKLKKINAILIQHDIDKEYIKLDVKDRFIYTTDYKISSIPDYINAIEPFSFNKETNEFEEFKSRVFIKTDKYNYLFKSDKKRVTTFLSSKCKVQSEKYSFTCIELENPITSIIDDSFIKMYKNNLHFIREYEIECKYDGDEILNTLLEKYIGEDVVIPYSLEERRKKYSLAFKDLESYMKKYLITI